MKLNLNLDDAEKIFESAWNAASLEFGDPASFARDIKNESYHNFVDKINSNAKNYIHDFVFSFYTGSVFIFTEAIDLKLLNDLKVRSIEWCKVQSRSNKQSITKSMLRPDLHEFRDWHIEDHGYGYSSTYEMSHFYRWNSDPIGVFDLLSEPFRLLHTINALKIRTDIPKERLKNFVDRVEINHYPPKRGGIAFHHDPISLSRFAITANLSQYGDDFKVGGFAVGLGSGKVLPVEPHIKVGSLVGFLPSVCHGVEIIDPHGPAKQDLPPQETGRWYAAVAMVENDIPSRRQVTREAVGYPSLRQQISAFNNKRS